MFRNSFGVRYKASESRGCVTFQPQKGMNLFQRLFPTNRSSGGAVWFEGRKITYAELRAETLRVAEVLNALGVGTGDRVAILLADSPEFITSFVAIISIGAIAVPINLALGREDQLFILKDCGACAAVVESQTASGLFEKSSLPLDLKNLILVRQGVHETALQIRGIEIHDFSDVPRLPLNRG